MKPGVPLGDPHEDRAEGEDADKEDCCQDAVDGAGGVCLLAVEGDAGSEGVEVAGSAAGAVSITISIAGARARVGVRVTARTIPAAEAEIEAVIFIVVAFVVPTPGQAGAPGEGGTPRGLREDGAHWCQGTS